MRKMINPTLRGKRKSLPHVQDLQHPRLDKPRLLLILIDQVFLSWKHNTVYVTYDLCKGHLCAQLMTQYLPQLSWVVPRDSDHTRWQGFPALVTQYDISDLWVPPRSPPRTAVRTWCPPVTCGASRHCCAWPATVLGTSPETFKGQGHK